jgi:Putative S-adenosyl-L-methionine-dependent methyltransferase
MTLKIRALADKFGIHLPSFSRYELYFISSLFLLISLRQPYYGHAIAQCLVSEYLLKYFPYEDLVIYEMGAGNGTLALNILDFLKEAHPEVYERTRYRIIEISSHLAEIQRSTLQSHSMVEVYNQDVFQWKQQVPEPCFFLAMEVVVRIYHHGFNIIPYISLGQLPS